MAAAAKAVQVAEPVITRIVIEMRRGQHDTGMPYPRTARLSLLWKHAIFSQN
jgi:hypothetical protein